jgi:hypothetical protein
MDWFKAFTAGAVTFSILLLLATFVPFDLDEGKTFFVEKNSDTIRVEYLPIEHIDIRNGEALAYFKPEPAGKKGNYLIRIAGDHKSFMELLNSCNHEMIHYDLAWEGLNGEQQHELMEEKYGETSLTAFKPVCYRMTWRVVTG